MAELLEMCHHILSLQTHHHRQVSEVIRTYGDIPLAGTTPTQSSVISSTRVGRPLKMSWSEVMTHPGGIAILSIVFFKLLRGKHTSLVADLIHRMSPHIRVANFRCLLSQSSPLHVLFGQVRGCRSNLMEILLKDALQVYKDYDTILALKDVNGVTLLTMIDRFNNRELKADLSLMKQDFDDAAGGGIKETLTSVGVEWTKPAPAPSSATAVSTNNPSINGDPSISLHRRNFITFDRIVELELEKQLDDVIYALSSSPSPSPSPPPFSVPLSPTLLNQDSPSHQLSVYEIRNLLSTSECQRLIRLSHGEGDSLAGEYLQSDRDSTRLLCRSEGLARQLFKRLESIIRTIHLHDTERRPMGWGTFGEWLPSHLNSCFRWSEYHPGSKGFTPHRDAAFVESPNERSIFTLLIYLNDTGSGNGSGEGQNGSHADDGSTTFYVPTHLVKGGLISDECPKPLKSIRPMMGHAVIFPHELIHSVSER